MGVTVSSEEEGILVDEISILRFEQHHLHSLVQGVVNHRTPVFVDVSGLKSLLSVALDRSLVSKAPSIVKATWALFQVEGVVCTREWLVCMILLCDAPWAFRISCLFDLFKNLGTEEIMNDDIILLCRTALVGMCRLWNDTTITPTEDDIHDWIEKIATGAYLRLERDVLAVS